MLPETQVTATSSASGEAAAYSSARLSSMPVSTSRISGGPFGHGDPMLPSASSACAAALPGRDRVHVDDDRIEGGEQGIAPGRLLGQERLR